VLVVGIDPGNTSGVAFMFGVDADDGGWERVVLDEVITARADSVGVDWWTESGVKCQDVAWWISEVCMQEREAGEDILIVMEDFVLSPTKVGKGAGGRNAVSPVLVGGLLWKMIRDWLDVDVAGEGFRDDGGDVSGVRMVISSPSAKKAIGDGKMRTILEHDDTSGERSGGHSVDALRHCVLAVRGL